MSAAKKIYVIYYSTYGHIYTLVQEAVKGINAVDGVEAVVYQVDLDAMANSSTMWWYIPLVHRVHVVPLHVKS